MAPFIRLIVPAGLGIVFASVTGMGWMYAAVCCAVAWTAAWYFTAKPGRGVLTTVYPWVAVFFFFVSATALTGTRTEGSPDGKYIYAEVILNREPLLTGRWLQADGDITAYRVEGSGWEAASLTAQLYLDSSCRAVAGEKLLVKGYFNAFDSGGNSYEALMLRRGYAGRIYVGEGSLLASGEARTGFAAGLHAASVRKMYAMPGEAEKVAVAAAMVSGDKRGIPRQVRDDYRDGGGAHLLAVSGLHVGIVFVIINLLLYLIPAVRGGHIVKNLLAVGVVWMFAVSAGLSPSVARAALMFSLAQFALAGGNRKSALNMIAASAFMMLAVNPGYYADPSFVLSYAAVLAIILFFRPVYSIFRTGSRILDAVISIYIVGIIASVAVAPFVLYWFGSVPLAGILVNPVVIFTAHIIVGAGAVWLIWPFGFGSGVFGWVNGWAVSVQNTMMEWCTSGQWSAMGGRLPLWCAVALYCVIIFSSRPLNKYVESRRRRLPLPV